MMVLIPDGEIRRSAMRLEIAFVDDQNDWFFFTAEGFLGDVTVTVAGVLGAVDDH